MLFLTQNTTYSMSEALQVISKAFMKSESLITRAYVIFSLIFSKRLINNFSPPKFLFLQTIGNRGHDGTKISNKTYVESG